MRPYITTYTGKRVNPLDLKHDDIDIQDIAHALALVNRFNGHTNQPINVAQHSWYVSKLCRGRECELQALLHDATEAYLGDMTKWLKMSPEMAAYREAEDRANIVIMEKFGCNPVLHPLVEEADKLMVRYEATYFGITIDHPDYPSPTAGENSRVNGGNEFWKPWDWQESEANFLVRAWFLGAKTEK